MTTETDRDAIRLAPNDNVATVLRPIAAGENLRIGAGHPMILAKEAIPLCHKIALAPIDAGEPVLKYGHPIGRATERIDAGRHVHVHNLRSARAVAEDAR